MRKQVGFGLLEIMLVLATIVAATVGVYATLHASSVAAAVRQEQDNAGQIVDGIASAYAVAPDYSTLTTATVSGVLNLPLDANDALNSALHVDLTVRPASASHANDSFELVYTGLSRKQCVGLASALAAKSQGIYIGSNTSVQRQDGSVPDESAIATQCAALGASETVAFRFTTDKTTFAATNMEACACAPDSEIQTLACASGQVGSITQRRTSNCTGGTPSCPAAAWSSWVTTGNTCGSIGAPIAPVTPASPGVPTACVPQTEMQQATCPTDQVGALLQQRSKDCNTGAWGAWVTVAGACTTVSPVAACTPHLGPQYPQACPAGQGGQEWKQIAYACDANGNEVAGAPQTVSSTCSASCAITGNCCHPTSRTQTTLQPCALRSYGPGKTLSQRQSSTCASATATPAWPSTWTTVSTSGSCATCPSDTSASKTQWVARSNTTCPTGQTGGNTWEAEQARTETTTYNCNHASGSTTAVATTANGTWADTGATRNLVSTCKATGGPGLPGKKCGDTCLTGWIAEDGKTCVKAMPACQ